MPAARSGVGPAARDRLAFLGLAAAGGALYFLAFVGFGLWPLNAIFLVPFWLALERARTRGPLASGTAGLVFGMVAYAGGYPWLWRIVDVFLDGDVVVGALFFAGYGLWFAAGFAAVALVFHALRRRGWPVAAAGIPPWLAMEWLHPLLFPVHAGYGLVPVPGLIQTADLGGPLLLTAWVAGANAVVFETLAWWRGERPRPAAAWAALACVAAAVWGYAALREDAVARAVQEAPVLRVGLVQANLGLLEKRTQARIGHQRHLEQTRELLAEGDVDLVVWPETAYVRGLRRPLPLSGRPIREDLGVPLLFGGPSVFQEGGRRRKANSAFLVGEDGVIRHAYDKNLLLPFAESVPFADRLPFLGGWLPHAREFRAARDTPPLVLGPWRIATPICYEVVRPAFVRRMVEAARPHWFVTLANDAWFGDSQEPWIHLALARVRAVEHRRYLVRATNSGVSAVVDPTGRVVARTGLLTRENLHADVRPLDGRTVYARLGDWPGALALAATLALWVVPARRGAR